MKLIALFVACLSAAPLVAQPLFQAPAKEERIVLIGNGLGERMQYYGNFETQLHLRFPDARLTVRNLCHPGDTAAYRPRAGRPTPRVRAARQTRVASPVGSAAASSIRRCIGSGRARTWRR
jgi:hypothetical protein